MLRIPTTETRGIGLSKCIKYYPSKDVERILELNIYTYIAKGVVYSGKAMLIEVKFGGDSFVLDVDSRFDDILRRELPFTTTLNVWKEEVYFEIPIELDVSDRQPFLRVEPGKLYYWPPGRGFCVFYGLSQPYSQVYPIGIHIGVLGKLRTVEDGVEAIVQQYRHAETYSGIVSKLESIGFKAATSLYEGESVVEAVGFTEGVRVGFKMYVEEYGVHIEGEPIYPQSYAPSTLKFTARLADLLSLEKHVRLDLDENGWVTITSYATYDELHEAVEELCKAYLKVYRAILQEG
jgi:hypothetical protein